MAKKAKIGRPATGHDPVTPIRVPQEFVDRVHEATSYMQASGRDGASNIRAATVWREVINLGLQSLHGETPRRRFISRWFRPKHDAEIHEAGHAVAMFLAAEETGRNPAMALHEVLLQPDGAGWASYGSGHSAALSPEAELRIVVAGCAAEAYDYAESFDSVWTAYPKNRKRGNDRTSAARLIRDHGLKLDDAVDYCYRKFSRPDIWSALKALARALEFTRAIDGQYCWEVYSAELRRAALPKRKGRKKPFDWRVGKD